MEFPLFQSGTKPTVSPAHICSGRGGVPWAQNPKGQVPKDKCDQLWNLSSYLPTLIAPPGMWGPSWGGVCIPSLEGKADSGSQPSFITWAKKLLDMCWATSTTVENELKENLVHRSMLSIVFEHGLNEPWKFKNILDNWFLGPKVFSEIPFKIMSFLPSWAVKVAAPWQWGEDRAAWLWPFPPRAPQLATKQLAFYRQQLNTSKWGHTSCEFLGKFRNNNSLSYLVWVGVVDIGQVSLVACTVLALLRFPLSHNSQLAMKLSQNYLYLGIFCHFLFHFL